jgi:multimeric flavodoxin WrbA
MMKVAIVHGQMHRGSTYHIARMVADRLVSREEDVEEFFLPKDGPTFCVGCYSCFNRGEEYCGHHEPVQRIVEAFRRADVIILDSPCYVFGVTGQMKTFLDHMGYAWMSHRPDPLMFQKTALVISTAAGAGAKAVTKQLKQNLFYWGVPQVLQYPCIVGAASWAEVKEEKKAAIVKDTAKLAARLARMAGNVKPGLKTRFMFAVMRLNQKRNDWNPLDKEHWEQQGWLGRKRPW